MKAQIALPPKLIPVFSGKARYRGAHGGRGSGKTFSFAKMTAVRGYIQGMAGMSGNILCCREFMNSLNESSFEEVKKAIISEPFLKSYYQIGDQYIRSKDKRINYRFAGLRHNINSIKSKSNILIAWIDEAEPVSEEAWNKLIPTVRDSGSEIWLTWNPEKKDSATDQRFKISPPDNSKIVELNWQDNPWFVKTELPQEREYDKKVLTEAMYNWKWEGDYLETSDESIIKPEYFGRFSDFPALKETAIIGDTGNKPKEHNDPTVYLFCGLGYDGNIYILDLFRDRMESTERESSAIDFWNKHRKTQLYPFGATKFLIEDIGTGSDLIQRLRRKGINAVATPRPRKRAIQSTSFTAKYSRLMDVIYDIANGVVYLPEKSILFQGKTVTDASWATDFVTECKEFMPDDSHDHDDQVDCLIDGISFFTKRKKMYAV